MMDVGVLSGWCISSCERVGASTRCGTDGEREREIQAVALLCSKAYKFKRGVRVFLKECTPNRSEDVTDGPGPSSLVEGASKSKVQAPLKGFKVYLMGRLSQSKPVLTQQIESLGGRVVGSVSETTTICISSESECGWVVPLGWRGGLAFSSESECGCGIALMQTGSPWDSCFYVLQPHLVLYRQLMAPFQFLYCIWRFPAQFSGTAKVLWA
jgi:hypothetical protein